MDWVEVPLELSSFYHGRRKKLVQAKELPPGFEGMNMDMFGKLVNAISASSEFSCDSEINYYE